MEVLLDIASKAQEAVIGKIRHLKDINFKSFQTHFDACVSPVWEYGSEVWSYKLLNVLMIFRKEQ